MNGRYSEMDKDQQMVQLVWPEWELMEQLGFGQFGVVYKARKQGFAGDSFAAIKIVTIENENNSNGFTVEQTDSYLSSVAQNYAREIKMMESVKGYSNIVNIEDYTVCKNSGGKPWYVLIRMELLKTLYEYLESQEISDKKVICIGVDLCKALEVCAKKQIVHRDIKPANVFVNSDGVFKLGDFGVARQILNYTSQTRTGSPDFMAPEIYNGKLHATDYSRAQSADIYSLGMLLYWISNKMRMPFVKQDGLVTADEIADAFMRKMNGEKLPDPVNASEQLKKVILKACAYDPSERYHTAEEFREALECIYNSEEKTDGQRYATPIIASVAILVVFMTVLALIQTGTIEWPPWPMRTPEVTDTPRPFHIYTGELVIAAPGGMETPGRAIMDEQGNEFVDAQKSEQNNTPILEVTDTPEGKPTDTEVSEIIDTQIPGENGTAVIEFVNSGETAETDSPKQTENLPEWPILNTWGISSKLRELGSGRHQAYLGPDKQKYRTAGAYQSGHVSSVTALFQEGGFILVDLYYPNVGRRCVYFRSAAVLIQPTDAFVLVPYPVRVVENTQPRLGPGEKYDKGKIAALKEGMEINALLEADGWIFAEFTDCGDLVRAWLPKDSIE